MWQGMVQPLLAQAAQAESSGRLSETLPSGAVIAIVLATLVLPWFLGVWLAKAFRVPDYGRQLGVVLFALILGLVVNVLKWPPRYGVDLSGGVNLIYELDQSQLDPDAKPSMDQLVAAVTKRVNPGGLKEVVVRPYGEYQVEIIIPKVEESEAREIEEFISKTGSLEFRILASRVMDDSIVALAEGNPARVVRDEALGVDVAKWIPLGDNHEATRLLGDKEFVVREGMRGQKKETYILVKLDEHNVTGQYLRRASVGVDARRGIIPAVDFQFDSAGAQRFGALTTENLPDQTFNRSRLLAVILDDKLFSAANIESAIYDRGQITSEAYGTNPKQCQDLVDVLNAGSLPAALKKEPVSRRVTGPLLGEDSIKRGQTSLFVATGAVLAFMFLYYRMSGLIACGALIMNVILTVGLMTLFNAAFTLPGLAGLVLTVGMAVDANVLIYERMREEQARGASLKMAIRNGFDRAWTAIFDSNVTTMISAVILFFIGTDQVKGFATTLFIGIAMSMFTAIFCARVAMEIAERKRWLRELHLTKIIGETHFDFVRWMVPAMAASAILILAGMAAVVGRGKGLLDIDFTGGVSVEAVFEESVGDGAQAVELVRERVTNVPQEVRDQVREVLVSKQQDVIKADIRKQLEAAGDTVDDATVEAAFKERIEELTALPDAAVSSIAIGREVEGRRFLIDTSNPSIVAVEEILSRLFADKKLVHNTVKVGPLAMVSDSTSSTASSSATSAAPPETPANTPTQGATPPVDSNDEDGANSGGPSDPSSNGCTQADDPTPAESPTAAAPADETPGGAEESPAADAASDTQPPLDLDQPSVPAQPETTTAESAEPGAAEATSQPSTPTEPPAPAGPETATSGTAPARGFAGGTSTTLEFAQRLSHDSLSDRVRKALDANGHSQAHFELNNPDYEEGSTQPFDHWDLRISLPPEAAGPVLTSFGDQLAAEPYFPSSSAIGGQVASNTQWAAIYALLASLVAIAAYLWIRFQRLVYGVAAVVALIHDVLVALVALAASYYMADYLGFLGVQQFKINLPIIAAFLTIIGFSINDTIVIFDRMREVRGKSPRLTADMINLSLNQTLSRTILTSLTVFITLIIMYAMGGQGIHGFAFCMLVGVISGTYSTVYIAAPLVLWIGAPRDVEGPAKANVRERPIQPVGTR